MDSEQLYENLLTLIERSEARIDKTNEMVQALARTCERNIEIYDKHLTSLEEARNLAQANAANSIEMSKNLTDLLTNLRNDCQYLPNETCSRYKNRFWYRSFTSYGNQYSGFKR